MMKGGERAGRGGENNGLVKWKEKELTGNDEMMGETKGMMPSDERTKENWWGLARYVAHTVLVEK